MRDKFRVVEWCVDNTYTLERQSIFGWWRHVDKDGNTYHPELFSRGSDLDVYSSNFSAMAHADSIVDKEQARIKKAKDKKTWVRT